MQIRCFVVAVKGSSVVDLKFPNDADFGLLKVGYPVWLDGWKKIVRIVDRNTVIVEGVVGEMFVGQSRVHISFNSDGSALVENGDIHIDGIPGYVVSGGGIDEAVLNNKVDQSYVDTELGKKADADFVNTELGKKADADFVNTELGKKADRTYVDGELSKKADRTYVDGELGKKVSETYLNSQLELKMDKSVYDANNNGVVDTAESIIGDVQPDYYYGTDSNGSKGFHRITGLETITTQEQNAVSVYVGKVNGKHAFKPIVAGSGVTITEAEDHIRVSASGGSGGFSRLLLARMYKNILSFGPNRSWGNIGFEFPGDENYLGLEAVNGANGGWDSQFRVTEDGFYLVKFKLVKTSHSAAAVQFRMMVNGIEKEVDFIFLDQPQVWVNDHVLMPVKLIAGDHISIALNYNKPSNVFVELDRGELTIIKL